MFTLQCHTGGIAATNGYLITLGDRHLVVDAPEGMAAWVEHLGVTPEALWLTHQHFDHCQDAAALVQRFECPLVAFSDYSRDLTLESLLGLTTGLPFSVPPFQVTHHASESEPLEALGHFWQVLHIPGHSLDSLCFYQPEGHLLLGGDVLFRDGVGRTDFPGGSWSQLLHGIETKILPLPDETCLWPGHGSETTVGRERTQNPLLQ